MNKFILIILSVISFHSLASAHCSSERAECITSGGFHGICYKQCDVYGNCELDCH